MGKPSTSSQQGISILHLVLSIGYTTDQSFTIIAAPIGLFRNRKEALITSQAEQEMGEVYVEGIRFKQRTAICEVKLPSDTTEAWAAWSNAFSQDGTGIVLGRIEGCFASSEEAQGAIAKVPQGFQEVNGHPCQVKSNYRYLKIQ